MRSPLPRCLRATGALLAALGLTSLTGPIARADTPAIPDFTDGFSLAQVADATEARSSTDFTITVTTPQVSGPHKIRIFLPSGYTSTPDKHWPVTYFLHGGGGSVDDAAAASALRSDKMITVVPDSGLKGWYADWLMQNTTVGKANWETFHLKQVVLFIDANLRTRPDRAHRAVVGLSMGGSGALHYAQLRTDLFGHTASLSGGIDCGMAEVCAAVLATELNLTGAWCAASNSSGTGKGADYGPYVDSDAIFGFPYTVLGADHLWNAYDPAAPANLSKLADTNVTLYTGDQGVIDANTAKAAATVKARLDWLGIPSSLVNYANGASLAPSCDGGHNYGCWAPAFADYVPRLEAAFAAAATN
ncbi:MULTISPECIES: alpha/beta hydrolase family protein [Streptomyces]|uniref:alpha/beta hydrolase n=1 Tax=Streptomyces TaxID=1883 RepID=UPI00093D0103|nr:MULTISPECIES: alpha/beta hydrolase-fold protein [unclassified Streptomyces]OKJ09426.1 esterase [Streptomyces sp. TSRI0261]QNQ38498.1 esterase [Streptomyces sp. CB00271]